MAETETAAADTLDEIEAAIRDGRSMGQGAWAILNRVQRLAAPTPPRDDESMQALLNDVADVIETETLGTFVGVADRLRALAETLGFTHDDVRTLLEASAHAPHYAKLQSLAARIAALLPPEEP